MISAQSFTHSLFSLLGFVEMPPLRRSVQEWIRKEIVDDDPCDEETFFPALNKVNNTEPEKTA